MQPELGKEFWQKGPKMDMNEITIQMCECMAYMGYHAVISDGQVVEFVKEFAE